jgi:hypothetical protein
MIDKIKDLKVKEGYLTKFNSNYLANSFDKRWVSLKECQLSYYAEDQGKKVLKGSLNFDLYSIEI